MEGGIGKLPPEWNEPGLEFVVRERSASIPSTRADAIRAVVASGDY